MIGTKLYKKSDDMKRYSKVAVWCNANKAHIVDKGDYYEVVANEIIEVEPVEPVPTLEERIASLETQQSESDDVIMALVEMMDVMNANK